MSDNPNDELAFDLIDAFFKRQEELQAALGLGDISTHAGTKGDDTELKWLNMLETLLPRRYGVTKAFVVDSHGSRSEQIDVVVHDRHFSPLLFEVGGSKYIPAESVYAAFEVKQNLDRGNLEYASAKVATVRSLHRTTAPVPHAGGVYDPVKPRRIIGGVLTRRSDWSPPFGEPFESCLTNLDDLDIGCAVEHGGFVVSRDKDDKIVSIEHSDANVALIYFVMRLLRQLQAVGSAPAIDYDEYFKWVPGTSEAPDGRTDP
jgi:hypothetical protein